MPPAPLPLTAATVLGRTGLVRPVRPDRLALMALSAARWGVTPAGGYAIAAARDPHRIAVVDDNGPMSFLEIDRGSDRVARGLTGLGVRAGDAVALLARNSAAFVLAEVALAKVGADVLYLNTGFAAPQVADVLESEHATAVVADHEFAGLVEPALAGRPLAWAWTDPAPQAPQHSVQAWLDDDPGGTGPHGNRRAARHVILTSGTTGRPKGASRQTPGGAAAVEAFTALLSAIPLRARRTTVLAAPMFHAWGFMHFVLGMPLESTLVLSRRFDPERLLGLVQRHRADVVAAVPVMLQRLLELPPDVVARYDTSSLRVVAVSGSALSPAVAERFRDRFGDVLHNLYGSTEVAFASVATPRDMREAPGSVGRPLPGVSVRIVDDEGRPVPTGTAGRIFVGSRVSFEGYTSGEDKDRIDGLVSTGDVGHLDGDGRLWVDGRDDEMIVSGGENVFPAEVEDCLGTHDDVADVAVVGVPDEQFGSRLVAHVVRTPGGSADEDALRRWVREHLAGYKVPKAVRFHDALPRNETGKVLKRTLVEDAGDG
jgi:acyl-CoA synthetase (AMP-forming)/AMP-acid ligase II